MPTPSYTLPSTQAVSLQVPTSQSVPAVGGSVVWSMTPTLGTLTPSNDGQSALFQPGSATLPLTKAIRNATANLVITSVAASVGANAAYTGTITGGAANALVGSVFAVTGCDQSVNNGTFICTASTALVLTLSNKNAVIETSAGTPHAASAATNTSYIGTITGGASNGINGDVIVITGFVNAGNNASVTVLASSATAFGGANNAGVLETHAGIGTTASVTTTTVTAVVTGNSPGWAPGHLYRVGEQIIDINGHTQQVTATTGKAAAVYTPNAGAIPQGGDSTQATLQYGGTLVSGIKQYGTVLNTDGGGANGDWPAGAIAAPSGNTKTPFKTTAATVTYVGVGYSAGRSFAGVDTHDQAGIDTPTSYSNDTRKQIATYSERTAHGLEQYYDMAGNLHTGWQIAGGTQTFSEAAVGQPPTFSITGGAVVDGDLTWTDQGAASTLATYAANITISSTAPAPYGYYVVLA